MAQFRVRWGTTFTSRRIRATATMAVSVDIAPRPLASAGTGKTGTDKRSTSRLRHNPAADDRPELRAKWRSLPAPIRPADWVAGSESQQPPGSLLIAFAEERSREYGG